MPYKTQTTECWCLACAGKDGEIGLPCQKDKPKESSQTTSKQVTLGDIEKARKVLYMFLKKGGVTRYNQDKYLELISVVDAVDDASDILRVLAFYLGVKHD